MNNSMTSNHSEKSNIGLEPGKKENYIEMLHKKDM